jgi:hypothetical protein
MYHYIYKTTNKLNGCYYIGCHSSKDLDNTYLGSGTILRHSIKKYGRNAFEKIILFLCKDIKTKFYYESLVVNKDVIKDPLCMNLIIGGWGSAGSKGKNNGMYKKIPWNKGLINCYSEERTKAVSESLKKYYETHDNWIKNKTHSLETRKKIREQKLGEKNPQYGRPAWNKGLVGFIKGKIPWNKGKTNVQDYSHMKGKEPVNKGKVCITNGNTIKYISGDIEMPCGWRKGRK